MNRDKVCPECGKNITICANTLSKCSHAPKTGSTIKLMQKRINFLEEALDAMKDLAGDNILFNQKLLDKNAALSLHNEVVTKDNLRMTIRVNAQRIVIEGFQEKTLWKRLKRNWGF